MASFTDYVDGFFSLWVLTFGSFSGRNFFFVLGLYNCFWGTEGYFNAGRIAMRSWGENWVRMILRGFNDFIQDYELRALSF